VIDRFIRTKTADEFFHQGQAIGVVTSRIYAPETRHGPAPAGARLLGRGRASELKQTFLYPGGPYSAAIRPGVSPVAPLLGEHNEEVFGGELGFSRPQLTLMTEAGVI
jgi:crotonobetainyl-CoA:carnitine CoA-transferase CaiB-like acyl-CoA transferase